MTAANKSILSDFFDIPETDGNFRAICKAMISASAKATSNLLLHLKRKHYSEYEKSLSTNKTDSQTTLMPLFSIPKKYANIDLRQVELTDATVNFIAGDLLPLSIVDSSRFHELMFKAEPRFQIPSRKHLSSQLLPNKSAHLKSNLKARLQKTDAICITIDLWTNRQMRSYYGVTCHFIVDFTLCSAMLACSRFHGAHTAEYIYEQFERIKANFEYHKQCFLCCY